MIDSFHKYPIFPDLLENQRRSVRFFWEKGILDELQLFSTLIGTAASDSPRQKEKSGSVSPVLVRAHSTGNVNPSPATSQTPPRPSMGLSSRKRSHVRTEVLTKDQSFPRIRRYPTAPSTVTPLRSLASGGNPAERHLQRSNLQPDTSHVGSSTNTEIEYLVLQGSKFVVKAPQYSQSDAIRYQKTYSVGLFLPIQERKNGVASQKPLTRSGLAPEPGQSEEHAASHPMSAVDNTFWFYFGEIPLMTDRGSFIINGAPRVLVNQIIRCPSVYFKVKLDQKNRRSYTASFLSEYGSWLRLETDRLSDRLWARIDKSPRFPADILLMGLGYQASLRTLNKKRSRKKDSTVPTEALPLQISEKLRFQGNTVSVKLTQTLLKRFRTPGPGPRIQATFLPSAEYSAKTNGDTNPSSSPSGTALQTIWKKCNPGRWTSSLGCYSFFYNKFLNPKRYSIGRVGRLRLNKRLLRNSACKLPTLTPEDVLLAFHYLTQLRRGTGATGSRASAGGQNRSSSNLELDDIDHLKNRRVRLPGEVLQNQFRLALSRIPFSSIARGPQARAPRFAEGGPTQFTTSSGVSYVTKGNAPPNGRWHTVANGGHQRPNGLPALCAGRPRAKGPSACPEGARPRSKGTPPRLSVLGAPRESFGSGIPAFQNTLRELFNTGQLSQYMDQTNPLAEITHKRRLSSLGPGGVGRDQAGFAVREIHPSHFGRICPIETPEGQNAGLVGSLASYARIHPDGFLQSPALPIERNAEAQRAPVQASHHPLRAVLGAAPTHHPATLRRENTRSGFRQKISLFSSELEDEVYVCTADTLNAARRTFERLPGGTLPSIPLDSIPSFFPVRYKQEFLNLKAIDAVEFIHAPTKLFTGVCPIQLISIATSLIPFLEHDDANRALMGSNMQRQAVPFMFPEKPLVGTGLELQAARDSSTVLLAKESGKILFVDSSRIRLKTIGTKERNPHRLRGQALPLTQRAYDLTHFSPSNQSTSLKQRPVVQLGEWVEKGDLLADGAGTHDGEVALGKNILLAYMPWEGYNFEDAIVINERLVFEDVYTSVHVERFEVDVRNTKCISLRTELHGDIALSQSVTQSKAIETLSTRDTSQVVPLLVPGEYLTRDLDILTSTSGVQVRWSAPGSVAIGAGDLAGSSFAQGITRDAQVTPPGEATHHSRLREVESGWLRREPFGPPGGPQTSRERGDRDGQSPSRLPTFGRLPTKLRHLDSRGIVKPGVWVQEGDILVGKVQIGPKQVGGRTTTGGGTLGRDISRAGGPGAQGWGAAIQRGYPEKGIQSRIPGAGLQTSLESRVAWASRTTPRVAGASAPARGVSGTLPFPEYRLLLAIFTENGRKPRTGNTGVSTVPGSPQDQSTGRPGWARRESRWDPSAAGVTPQGLRTSESIPLPNDKLTSVGIAPSTIGSTEGRGRTGSSNGAGRAGKNTSFKVGIGLKGRVLECLMEGVIPTYGQKKQAANTEVGSPSRAPSTLSIFLAHKKRIQLGDKMSGRHGNKGIVSLILPPQDMPYLQDGKPIDVVLNPLGVPSRMNVGQVLETLLGLSAFYSNKMYRVMPFDERIAPENKGSSVGLGGPTGGPKVSRRRVTLSTTASAEWCHSPTGGFATRRAAPPATRGSAHSTSDFQPRSREQGSPPETSRSLVYGSLRRLKKEVNHSMGTRTQSSVPGLKLDGAVFNWLFDANNPGKTQLFDGRTGELFYQPVLVGYSYMFKLIHLVDDKIHARSTGPYSLVTQQPLGGRSKKGGQRLGEMEVWALEGFGTASILQEFLTVKSDEIYSRNHFLFHLMRRNWDSGTPSAGGSGAMIASQSLLRSAAGTSPKNGSEPIRAHHASVQTRGSSSAAVTGAWQPLVPGAASVQTPEGRAPRLRPAGGARAGNRLHSSVRASKLPESFRVLINELHSLCLSVYSNLPS